MKIVVTGASSQIGDFLIPKLVRAGHFCYYVSRKPPCIQEEIKWVEADLGGGEDFFADLGTLDVWINIAPLYLAKPWLKKVAEHGIGQFIGFGTTSIYTKQNSSNPEESRFIYNILDTENYIKQVCKAADIAWTVLRPTLIYGCGRDHNVAFIKKMIRRFGFFPVVGDAHGLRQPVHAEDLAEACLAAIENPRVTDKAYNLSGGEILTYYEMVERIFRSIQKPPRILSVPVPLLKCVIRLLALMPPLRHLNPEMVERINLDMVFDHTDAVRDLGFKPRGFLS